MEDKIILKFKTKNILNFYEIEPRSWENSFSSKDTRGLMIWLGVKFKSCKKLE